jgi:hypothetical protein
VKKPTTVLACDGRKAERSKIDIDRTPYTGAGQKLASSDDLTSGRIFRDSYGKVSTEFKAESTSRLSRFVTRS